MRLPRARCHVCNRDVPLRKGGELRLHRAGSEGGATCHGSGQLARRRRRAATAKTIAVDLEHPPPMTAIGRLVGCAGGSPTYHIADTKPSRPPTGPGWRAFCGVQFSTAAALDVHLMGGNRRTPLRLCRACVEALGP